LSVTLFPYSTLFRSFPVKWHLLVLRIEKSLLLDKPARIPVALYSVISFLHDRCLEHLAVQPRFVLILPIFECWVVQPRTCQYAEDRKSTRLNSSHVS